MHLTQFYNVKLHTWCVVWSLSFTDVSNNMNNTKHNVSYVLLLLFFFIITDDIIFKFETWIADISKHRDGVGGGELVTSSFGMYIVHSCCRLTWIESKSTSDKNKIDVTWTTATHL